MVFILFIYLPNIVIKLLIIWFWLILAARLSRDMLRFDFGVEDDKISAMFIGFWIWTAAVAFALLGYLNLKRFDGTDGVMAFKMVKPKLLSYCQLSSYICYCWYFLVPVPQNFLVRKGLKAWHWHLLNYFHRNPKAKWVRKR